MAQPGLPASPVADFARFISAVVAVEPSGTALSVLSTLSRRGLDPLQEARRLAQLPPLEAAEGLAEMLRAEPAVQAARLDAKAVAVRLVALLPSQGAAPSKLLSSRLSVTPVPRPRGLLLALMAAGFANMSLPTTVAEDANTAEPAFWLADAPAEPTKRAMVPVRGSGISSLSSQP